MLTWKHAFISILYMYYCMLVAKTCTKLKQMRIFTEVLQTHFEVLMLLYFTLNSPTIPSVNQLTRQVSLHMQY